MSGLSAIELTCYVFTWVGSVLYSMYQFYLASDGKQLFNYICRLISYLLLLIGYSKYFSEDLVPSWKWVGRKADTADFEWKMWTPIFINWLQYVIAYLIISLAIKKNYPHAVSLISTAISYIWLWKMLGFKLTILIYIQPVLFYLILKFSFLAIVWIVCIGFALVLHSSFFRAITVSLNSLILKSLLL